MTDKLLPCPFCESKEGTIQWDEYFIAKVRYYRRCTTCLSAGPSAGTRAAAIAAWNQRPTVPDVGEARGREVEGEVVGEDVLVG